jgi:hypothetical protein
MVGSRMTTSLKRLLGRSICVGQRANLENVGHKTRVKLASKKKKKKWKEQTGVERRLIAFAMYSDEQPEPVRKRGN